MLKVFYILLFSVPFSLVYGGESKVNDFVDVDIAWGGFYASVSEDSGTISVFRLLDFNRDAYHVAIYSEKFDSTPSVKEIISLSPFIGHAPIDTRALINNKSVVLFGEKELTTSDLEGYMYYLEEFGVSEGDREKLTNSLISYSKEQPLKLRLSLEENNLQISKRN